jgi:hypothetical protein
MAGKISSTVGSAIACAALFALAGCADSRSAAAADVNEDYLSGGSRQQSAQFSVDFVEFGTEESAVVEQVWSEASPPEQEAASLWNANGLRFGVADAAAAKNIKATLRRATTLVRKRHLIMLKAFEIEAGQPVSSAGLLYATKDQTAYRDVAGLQLVFKFHLVGIKGDSRLNVTPGFRGREGRDPVLLEDLSVLTPVSDGAVILAGPVRTPPEMRLGSLLYRQSEGGKRGTFVLVEIALSR